MITLKPYFLPVARPVGLLKAMLFLVGLAACLQVNGQGWEIYFGGGNEDFGHSIIQTQDRGYVGVGYSESFIANGNQKAYVIRTDVDGIEIWSKVYDDGFIEHGYSTTETPEHDFLVVGDIRPTQLSDPNVYLLKINASGQKLWSKQFGGTGNDVGYRIIPTTVSGGYLIVGYTTSFGNGQNDVFLLKIDAQGNQVWANAYGTPGEDFGRSVLEVADGYLVAGSAFNPANGTTDGYLLKVDFSGTEIWSKFFGSATDIDQLSDLVLAADGNVALAGFTGSSSDGWLFKTDLDGNQIWSKTFGGSLGDDVYDLLKTTNGDLVVTGYTELTSANSDAFLARFDNDGNQLWMNTVGRGSHTDVGQGLAPTEDGGFIVIGYNSIFGNLGNDVTFIKAGPSGLVYTNHLTGKVFVDGSDCVFQTGETGLNDWIVRASSPAKTFFGTTDANGNYDMTVDSGNYQVSVLVKNAYWDACIAAYNVTFTTQYDTLVRNFPILKVVDCPLLEVDISAPVAQNCSNISYTVSYCNTGTAVANTPSVHVILDNGLSYTGSSIPVTSQNDSLYVFDLGPLGLDECGSFYISVTSDCSGLPAEAYTVSAHIFPDSICLPASPNWDMASVDVNGYCDVDSVRFIIENEGIGDMAEPKHFIVIEDNVMLMDQPQSFQLLAEHDTTIVYYAGNGSTYRIIAEQSSGHPGSSYPTIAVEGCTTTGGYSTGFVTELQEDENDPFISIDVQESISSFSDYIFLRGYPKGYLENGENLIPANTDIEYHVYFQNAGTDTITRVVIRDTLSANLDLGTVVAGASSHPYDFEAYSNGVLKFTFENMLLAPGGGAGSEGFVKFRIAQKPDNPTGTQIPNSATVFLGYDAPFQTATYTHVVGGSTVLDFVVVSDVESPEMPGVTVSVYPNPFASAIEFETEGRSFKTLTINVFDMSGQLVRRENASGNRLRLQRGSLPSGIYAYRLEADELLLDTGKIIVR
ncbi:MAG: T9SS type A sorting domain-containing protein [Bacteroidetes bacterium]|nr:T9SS type A sorting domain-containing protein [Bacteroidota bacterium]